MQLLMSPASPFVRKVRVVIRELDLTAGVEEVAVTANVTGPDATITAANPSGKIPALVRDEGPTLYDSRVICRYLSEVHGGGLYPASRIWEVLTLEATGDALMEAAVLMVYEERYRDAGARSEAWVEGQWAKVARSLEVLEARWMGLLSGPLNAGQISVGCALGYLDFRLANRDWRSGHPALAAWAEKIGARESFVQTAPS